MPKARGGDADTALLPESWRRTHDGVVHLCVTCVSSKNLDDGPQFRDFRTNDLNNAFNKWKEGVEKDTRVESPLPIKKLYTGTLWGLFLQAFDVLDLHQMRRQLWVISAGLGLVSGEDPAPESGYSATFARPSRQQPSPDFVGTPRWSTQDWWNLLAKWRFKCFDHTRSVHGLYNGLNDGDVLIIICGADYFNAIRDDLAEIQSQDKCGLVLAAKENVIKRVRESVPTLRQRAFAFDCKARMTAPGKIAVEAVKQVVQEIEQRPLI
jgi:hypothetical protein